MQNAVGFELSEISTLWAVREIKQKITNRGIDRLFSVLFLFYNV